MKLTADQTDAFTELINIGYGRAAAALSEMTGYRLKLEVPKISLHAIDDVEAILSRFLEGEAVSINQVFSGPFSGNAMLLLDAAAALLLSQLLVDPTDATGNTLDATARETLSEAGNILLTACLGAFSNLLEVQVSFAIPHLNVESVSALLKSITAKAEDLSHALIVRTRFELRASNVHGYFVIILGVTSLQRVLQEIDRWERRL